MKTTSKFRKNRRSRTTNKKRGGNWNKNTKSKAAYKKGMNFPIDMEEYERQERANEYEKTKENSQKEAKINRERIEDCKTHETLHDWNDKRCSNIFDEDEKRNINFFKDTKAGQNIAETWPQNCPDSTTYDEFLKNGCWDWKKEGQYYTWEDTEAGKKENEKRMNDCMNKTTEDDFKNERCFNVELGKDGNHKALRWFDTNEGKKDLTAKQEGCMTDPEMTKHNFDAYDCDTLGHVWRKSAAYEKIEREEHIRSINGLKYELFANVNNVFKSIKEYTKVATDPTQSIGKEVYQLIYEKYHPNKAWSGLKWERFGNTVKQQVNDFVNNQEENEQNKIRKYVENKRTCLKHNKHITDLINKKIENLTKEMEAEAAKAAEKADEETDVVKIKKTRIEELNSVLPKKLFITLSEQQYKDYAVTDEEKNEIENEIEEKLNEGVESNNLELIEETRGGKRKRNRKTKKSKKSKKSKRRTRRFKF